MGWFSGHYNLRNKLIVISGGSQGLGASIARLCVERGANVYIVARTEWKLQKVVKSLKESILDPDQIVGYVAADLSKQAECARVYETIGQVPDIVMCVAGLSLPGLLLEVPSESFETSIDCIYKSSLYFSVEALRVISKAPKSAEPRHITLFSSVVAFLGFIGYGSYSPLKQAVRGLADVLRQEAIPFNVKVECVFPGNIDTEGFENEEKTKPEITKQIEGPSDVMNPDKCAELILSRLDSGQQMVHTDAIGWILNGLMLGSSPRTHGVFLTLTGFILSLVVPIWNLIVNNQIKTYFKKREELAASINNNEVEDDEQVENDEELEDDQGLEDESSSSQLLN
ncbi:uncharacterized protein SAPINGB_P004585 [Magnusiomyces paraingens]|uniref:3-ketodihydrosphingosine reductase TSC10 n=1 Tax=Magnusiomyces paraingens TaxID=2606893 RepID=A0A5E8C2P7_9ASCO|nr:uncharacterized protein SAPINGB_P004585 [Saprochaete ingens]VVT55415.1 unnamed protein product [Saprochaete ingens]